MKNCMILLTSLVLMLGWVSCTENDSNISPDELKLQIDQLPFQTEDLTAHRDAGDNPPAIPVIGPGTDFPTFSCYTGGVAFDYDCDGSFEVGANFSAATLSDCICQINERILRAQQNGWCYDPGTCKLDECWRSVDFCSM